MTKGIFAGLVFVGILSAVFSVLAPIHEIWHWLAAFLQGVHATMSWSRTYIDTDKVGLFIGFAGMYGEITVLTLLFLKLTQKNLYGLAVYLYGYTLSYIAIAILYILGIFTPVDIEIMMENCNHLVVNAIFYGWMVYLFLALLIQTLVIREFREDFLGVGTTYHNRKVFEGAKSIVENDKKERENDKIRENRYKPLTLVK